MTANKMNDTNNFSYTPGGGNLYQPSWFYDSAAKLKDNYTSFVNIPSEKTTLVQESDEDDFEGMFKDKLRFQKLSALQALYLINERESLRDKNVSSIDSRTMYCHENLSRLRMWLGRAPSDSRAIGNLQKLVIDLERERRDQKTASWKDTLELKLSLLDKIQGYQNLKRQETLLEDVSGY
jgi:hypothetical protein